MLLVHTGGLKGLTRVTNTAVTHQAAEHDRRLPQCPSGRDHIRSTVQEQQALTQAFRLPDRAPVPVAVYVTSLV